MDPAERAALSAALADQVRRAARLVDGLEEASASAPRLDAADWRGAAADAFRAADERMRHRLAAARSQGAGLAGELARARAVVGG